jgi:hypothetical protein
MQPDAHTVLVWLAWIVGVSIVLWAIALIALRWLVVRVTRGLAVETENRINAALARGLPLPAGHAVGALPADLEDAYLTQIDRLAWVMDRVIPLPFIGGIGLDPIIGLLPVAGDAISMAISSLIIVRAVQIGAPPDLVRRLIAIQLTDFLLGVVPVLGDGVDVVYQADRKCAELIRAYVSARRAAPASSQA